MFRLQQRFSSTSMRAPRRRAAPATTELPTDVGGATRVTSVVAASCLGRRRGAALLVLTAQPSAPRPIGRGITSLLSPQRLSPQPLPHHDGRAARRRSEAPPSGTQCRRVRCHSAGCVLLTPPVPEAPCWFCSKKGTARPIRRRSDLRAAFQRSERRASPSTSPVGRRVRVR